MDNVQKVWLTIPHAFSSNHQKELSSGGAIMISNFAINAYVNSNIVILGFFTNAVVVGYYSVAEKLLYCVRQIMTLFFQATYPQVCKAVKTGHRNVVLFFRKFVVPFSLFILMICVGTFVFATKISVLAVGSENADLINAIRLFSIVPLATCVNIPAYQSLLAYNFQNSAMIILVSGSILNLLLNLVLASKLQLIGTVYSVIITEVFIAAGLHVILRSRHPQIKLTLQK